MKTTHRLLVSFGVLATALSGCTSTGADANVAEAGRLVEQHLGQMPQWNVPPDQAWDGRSVLTEREAVAIALRNNRELRAELEMIGQADADLLQAGLLQNPVINFMIMFPDGGGRSMLRGQGLPMQPLQDLWLIPARKKVAQAEVQQAVLAAADRAIETAANVKKVYARLQYQDRAIQLLRENIEIINQSVQIMQARLAAGGVKQTAVTLMQIRELRVQSELVSMQADERASQRELLMLMGMAAAPASWRVEPLPKEGLPAPEPTTEETLLAIATEQRLDFKAAEWKAQGAARNITLMKREGWPELSLGLGIERAPAPRSNNQSIAGQAANYAADDLAMKAQGMTPFITPPPAFSPKMREVKWTIGPMLEMEVPIFDWSQAKVARARHEFQQRVMQYEAKYQELARMVREKRVMLAQAGEQIRLYRESIVPAVERNLDVSRRALAAGQEDLTVYFQTQEDLLMTRLKILEFYRDYLVTRAELEREIGGSLELLSAATQPALATQPTSMPE